MWTKQILFFFGAVLIFNFKLAQASECVDLNPRCAGWKSSCANVEVLRTFCPVTCGTCVSEQCMVRNGGCDHICNEFSGNVQCSCRPGFQLNDDNKTCQDVDECSLATNPCGDLPCLNNAGSFSCRPRDCPQVAARASVGDDSSHDWPAMAQIIVNGQHRCGATLITNRWLLTSSLCLNGVHRHSISVYMGHVKNALFHNITDSPNRVLGTVKQIFIHELADSYNNSVALIELNDRVSFNNYIQPTCLPNGAQPRDGVKCWGTGFGFPDETSVRPSTLLKEVDIPIVSIDECRRSYADTPYTVDRNTMQCAGYREGGRDLCFGDLGGPLMCQRESKCELYISGITQFGRGCGRPGNFGAYTNVGFYEQWIREKLGADSTDLC